MVQPPRTGGPLADGSVATIEALEGGGAANIGSPPKQDGQDWAALIVKQN